MRNFGIDGYAPATAMTLRLAGQNGFPATPGSSGKG